MYESLAGASLLALEPVLPGRPSSLPRQDGDDPGRSGPVGRVAQDRSNDPSRLLDQLNRDQPGDPRGRADLALAHHYMAKTLMKQGSPEEAMRHQRAAIDLRKGLAEEFPKQLSYRIDLALSLSNLGCDPDARGQDRRGIRFRPRGQRDPAEPGRGTPRRPATAIHAGPQHSGDGQSSSTPWADGRRAGRSSWSRSRSWAGSSPRIRPSPSSGAVLATSASRARPVSHRPR